MTTTLLPAKFRSSMQILQTYVDYTDSGFQRNASIIFAQPRRIIILAEPEFKTDVFLHELFGELELECHVTGRTLRRRPASVSDVARL